MWPCGWEVHTYRQPWLWARNSTAETYHWQQQVAQHSIKTCWNPWGDLRRHLYCWQILSLLHFVCASTACSLPVKLLKRQLSSSILTLLAMLTINLVTHSTRKSCDKITYHNCSVIWLALPTFQQGQQHPILSHQTLLPPSSFTLPTNHHAKGLGHARLHQDSTVWIFAHLSFML